MSSLWKNKQKWLFLAEFVVFATLESHQCWVWWVTAPLKRGNYLYNGVIRYALSHRVSEQIQQKNIEELADQRCSVRKTIKSDRTAALRTWWQREKRARCKPERKEKQRVRKMLLILSATSPSIEVLNWKLLAVKYHSISWCWLKGTSNLLWKYIEKSTSSND